MTSKCHSLEMPFRNAMFGPNLLLLAYRGWGIVGEGLRGEGREEREVEKTVRMVSPCYINTTELN